MARGKAFGSRAGLSEGTVFRWLALKKAVFGSRVLVGDKSQLVFWWLALARRMYQTDYVGRTCLCYSQTAAGASKVLLLCFGVPVLSNRSWSYFVYLWLRFVTYLPLGARDPSFLLFCCFSFFLSPFARFVEMAVYGCGTLVGATSQHFAGSFGREHIFSELHNTYSSRTRIVCRSERFGGSHYRREQ